MINKFLELAQYYNRLGLTVLCISPQNNIFNFGENNLLKAPNHDQNLYRHEKQTLDDLRVLDWDRASGISVALGHDNIYAIDIDGCTDFKFIQDVCRVLNLPADYEWITKSGSHDGYHILFRCNDIRKVPSISKPVKLRHLSEKTEPFPNEDTNAYYPFYDNRAFSKIEFKWSGNLVLPPSLHVSGKHYEFIAHKPADKPCYLDFYQLLALKTIYCSIQAEHSEYTTRQFIARKDEELVNYSTRRIEPYIIVQADTIRINSDDLIRLQAGIVLTQITWLILDKNFNLLKRKSYNYFNKKSLASNSNFAISLDNAHLIVSSKRSTLLEFLFDLGHAEKIIAENSSKIKFIKDEILTSGLYLDNFYRKYTYSIELISEISESPSLEKEQIFFADNQYDNNLTIGKLYSIFLLNQGISGIVTELTDDEIDDFLSQSQEIIYNTIHASTEKISSNHFDNTREQIGIYEEYSGSYAQEQEGYSDQDIDDIFDGDPDNYWNID